MNAASRLDRVMPKLTFEERLRGVLEAYHGDRRADPALLGTMPRTDAQRWNTVASLLNGLHTHLGWYIDCLEAHVGQVELRFAVTEQTRLASLLLDGDARERLAHLADELACAVIADLVGRWEELRLAEEVAAAFAEEAGVAVLLHPHSGSVLVDCRARLLRVPATLDSYRFELPEPDEADVERLLSMLRYERLLP